MMDLLKSIPHHMDYEGQRLAERIFQVLIVLHGIIGFGVGYATQQLSLSVYILGFGFALSSLIVLPPWPFYRRHPLPWLKSAAKKDENSGPPKKKKK